MAALVGNFVEPVYYVFCIFPLVDLVFNLTSKQFSLQIAEVRLARVFESAACFFFFFFFFQFVLWPLRILNASLFTAILILPLNSSPKSFMNQQLGLFPRFGLWSLSVINASLFAAILILPLSYIGTMNMLTYKKYFIFPFTRNKIELSRPLSFVAINATTVFITLKRSTPSVRNW